MVKKRSQEYSKIRELNSLNISIYEIKTVKLERYISIIRVKIKRNLLIFLAKLKKLIFRNNELGLLDNGIRGFWEYML